MRRSLPIRGDPRTWSLMVRVGKILMRIGLLFKVIRNVSPFAALNIGDGVAKIPQVKFWDEGLLLLLLYQIRLSPE